MKKVKYDDTLIYVNDSLFDEKKNGIIIRDE